MQFLLKFKIDLLQYTAKGNRFSILGRLTVKELEEVDLVDVRVCPSGGSSVRRLRRRFFETKSSLLTFRPSQCLLTVTPTLTKPYYS